MKGELNDIQAKHKIHRNIPEEERDEAQKEPKQIARARTLLIEHHRVEDLRLSNRSLYQSIIDNRPK